MVEHVPERTRGGEPGAQAQGQGDFTDLPQGGVGQHAFDVVLVQGHNFAVDQGGRAQGHQPCAQPGKAHKTGHAQRAGLYKEHSHNAEHAHLGDHARKRTGNG